MWMIVVKVLGEDGEIPLHRNLRISSDAGRLLKQYEKHGFTVRRTGVITLDNLALVVKVQPEDGA